MSFCAQGGNRQAGQDGFSHQITMTNRVEPAECGNLREV